MEAAYQEILGADLHLEPEEKYHTLINAIDEAFCIIQVVFDEAHRPVDYLFVETNTVFEKQTGLVNAVGKRVRELVPGQESYWFEIYGRIALNRHPEHFEQRAKALQRWYEVTAFPMGQPEQHLVGVVFRDITRRKMVEDALRRSEERFRRALSIETVGVIFFHADGRVVEANDAFLRMSGYSRADLEAGLVRWDLMTPSKWMARSLQAVEEFKARGRTVPYEKQYIRKDGSSYWALFAAQRIAPDEGVEFIINIDESKRAAEALAETRSQLQETKDHLETVVEERTAKLREAIAELHHVSYAMVHDMRAPLRAMRSFAELLQPFLGDDTPPAARDYCRRIIVAAERLDELVADALNYTKVLNQELPTEPVDLNGLISGLIDTYPNLHLDNAQITIDGTLPVVRGNRALLTQCFSNLLGNAVKFVPAGISPKVRVWSETLAPQPESGCSCARIWVEDNGVGIPPTARDRIFNLFQRFHPEYPGTGVGLAIVRKVAERMGGSVGVESEEDHGSRFWVNLPVSD